MKKFMDENFVLETKTSEILFHNHAKDKPIIDYHSHLNPKEIAEDKRCENLTQLWLMGDHYKWRAMRANGVDEAYLTGNKSDWEKFEKWAETVPYTLRNPLYHWTHLELQRYFGIDRLLGPETAKEIWDETCALLKHEEYSTKNLLRRVNLEVVCTTDDPVDSLEYHKKIRDDGFEIKVLPTWRPDKAMAIENVTTYNKYLDQLAEESGKKISSYRDLIEALRIRQDFFEEMGCRLSDHGMDKIHSEDYTDTEIDHIFKKLRSGKKAENIEVLKFKSAMLYDLGVMDYEKGWTQQYHYGVIRNNNTRFFNKLGPDTGFDSILDIEVGKSMMKFFDKLDMENKLAKTIIYNLNPRDNELIATLAGNFQDGSIPGKMQFGSGWWFLDQKDGMEKQMNALSNLGLLSRFVGMLTDSRSFLSYTRHEYFRRILCNLIGNDVEKGLLPNDIKMLGTLVENVCYNNAKKYFNF